MTTLAVVTKQVGEVLLCNSPTILTGLGVGGFITTVIMAVRATSKAIDLLRTEESIREYDPISKLDTVKITWQCYFPTLLMGTATILCVIGANSINLRRNAALAGLYGLAETTLREYQAKVLSTIGEKAQERIHEDILQDRINLDPPEDKEIIFTGNGDVLCYDSLSGRYFKSNIELIRKVQNDFNMDLIHEFDRSLNEFYDALNLEHTELGNIMGWAVDYAQLDIRFSAKLTKEGVPCVVLDYRYEPKDLKLLSPS